MVWVREIDRWFIHEVLPHADAYHRQARRWAVDRDAARDIVQDAYARVIALPDWRDIDRPRAYVMLVVRNVAIDRLRQARVLPFDRDADMALLNAEDEQPSAFAVLAARQTLSRVRAAIQALPPQCRRVVELRKFEDCPPGEIADRMGISVSTVEKHLVKGLRVVMQTLAVQTENEQNDDPGPSEQQHQRSSGRGGRVAGPARRRNG